MNTVTEKCPGCGYILKYNIEKKKWSCEYCGRDFALEELENQKITESKELDSYYCPNCGAEILCNHNDITSDCLYCGSPVIIGSRIAGEFKPDFILPFEHSKEAMKQIFKELHSERLLSTKKYFKKGDIISIEGMYVPYWLVSSEVSVSFHGTAQKDKGRLLHFRRSGSISYKRVPAVGKTALLNKDLSQLEPFDYSKLKPFRYSYLSGFYAEKYDTSKDEIYKEEVKERLERASLQKLLTYGKNFYEHQIFSKNINIFCTDYEYALVPIWILKVKYKGKIYDHYINDQNLKVAGRTANSILKSVLLVVISVALSLGGTLFLLKVAPVFGALFYIFILLLASYLDNRKRNREKMDKIYISGIVNVTDNSEEYR